MTLEVEMNGVEMGMSRRSWSALLDIMGVIGVEEKEKNDQPKGGKSKWSSLHVIHLEKGRRFTSSVPFHPLSFHIVNLTILPHLSSPIHLSS